MREFKRRVHEWNPKMLIWVFSLLILTAWELVAVFTRTVGGPLSHFAWWIYGDVYTLRWFVAAGFFNGLFFWTAWHFMYQWPGPKELGLSILSMIAIGFMAWAALRILT